MTLDKQLSLEDVHEQFKTWRETREHKTSIPEELWSAAISLSGQYSLSKISNTLQVNYTALKDMAALLTPARTTSVVPQPFFLELPFSQSSSPSKCLIEMENMNGEKIRIHFTSEAHIDLLALTQIFWVRQS